MTSPATCPIALSNFRDAGATLFARPSRLYRSARLPPNASNPLQLRTVLDLRSKTELSLCPPLSPDTVSWDTVNISLLSRRLELHLLLCLPIHLFLLALFWLLVGQRMRAARLLTTRVMGPMGVVGLTIETMRFAEKEVKSVVDVLADPARYPVLVHCTQGKDRTGLVVMLVAMAVGARGEDVRRDFRESTEGLREVRVQLGRELNEAGLGLEWLEANEEVVDAVEEWCTKEFGSVRGYLRHCRVTEGQLKELDRCLMGDNIGEGVEEGEDKEVMKVEVEEVEEYE